MDSQIKNSRFHDVYEAKNKGAKRSSNRYNTLNISSQFDTNTTLQPKLNGSVTPTQTGKQNKQALNQSEERNSINQ